MRRISDYSIEAINRLGGRKLWHVQVGEGRGGNIKLWYPSFADREGGKEVCFQLWIDFTIGSWALRKRMKESN